MRPPYPPTLAFGFRTLGLARIIALVLPVNAGSIRVLDKIGMRPDRVVDYEGQEVLRYVADNPQES